MTRGSNPILIKYRTAAPVSTREAEKGRSTYGYLPGPSAEWRVFTADDPRFRPWKQWWYPALHILALIGGCDRHHRTRSFLGRSLAIDRSLRCNDIRTRADCAIRRDRHC